MAAPEIKKPAVTLLALACSLALHAVAFAALLADWRSDVPEEPVLSVELVIVSAPLETPSIDQPAAGEPVPAAVAEAMAAPEEPVAPIAPAVEAVKAPPPQPKPKPEPVRQAAPRPQPAPRPVEAPVNLNPGSIGGDWTQQARAPAGAEAPASFSVLHGPIPPYPAAARSRGQEGRVVLDVAIGIDGTPVSVAVAGSSGAPLLDEAAVATVKTWRFRNDSRRVLNVTVPIVFELRSTAGR